MELIGLYTVHKNDKTGDENGYPVHRHGSHEILLPLGGRCGVIISDTVYELDTGDAVLIFKDTPHKLITKDKPVEFLAAQFIPRVCASPDLEPALEEFAEYGKSGGAVFSVSEGVINTVRACMRRICDERTDTDIGMYFTYIRSVLYELSHNSVPKHGVVTAKKSAANEKTALLNAVTDYIGANLDTLSDLSFIERVFHYSNSHVNRIFRSSLGVSVWQYVTVKRLDLAYNLIADGISAKNAAGRSGFSDYSVFYKSFVKHFGAPPSSVKNKR